MTVLAASRQFAGLASWRVAGALLAAWIPQVLTEIRAPIIHGEVPRLLSTLVRRAVRYVL
jgi:hypothetical protein